jgi:hypothetical protein
MKSCNVRSRCFWVRSVIRFAIHNTMRLCCRGHSMTCGHVIHPPGMWSGAVLSIYAKRCFLQAHIIFPSPSVNNAVFECVLSQILVIDGSRWFVGNISWITLYHADLLVPGTGVSCCSVRNSEILDSVPEYRPPTRESGPCQLRVIAHDESPLLSW